MTTNLATPPVLTSLPVTAGLLIAFLAVALGGIVVLGWLDRRKRH